MPKLDLRVYKKDIRTQMRAIRRDMSPETATAKNEAIFRRICVMDEYRYARTLVTYVSKELEVDTIHLIQHALNQGKRVAVPRCVENTRVMNMHFIRSLDDLEAGSYGILEPSPSAPVLHRTRDAIAIVPAFCNDLSGYRIGYGGGYYDRYLYNFQGVKVGVNYTECVKPRLINGRYDVPVDILVTDQSIIRIHTPSISPSAHKWHGKNRRHPQK